MARLVATRRGDSVQIEGVSNPADPDGYAEWASAMGGG
jgi:hypothetical protein